MVANPNNYFPASSGGLDHPYARLGVSPIYIYIVLNKHFGAKG
jgi:hypothetical protein